MLKSYFLKLLVKHKLYFIKKYYSIFKNVLQNESNFDQTYFDELNLRTNIY